MVDLVMQNYVTIGSLLDDLQDVIEENRDLEPKVYELIDKHIQCIPIIADQLSQKLYANAEPLSRNEAAILWSLLQGARFFLEPVVEENVQRIGDSERRVIQKYTKLAEMLKENVKTS